MDKHVETLVRQSPPEAFLLTVRQADDNAPRQFVVENNHNLLELAHWDKEYASFSGFFGVHGPHVFAAAPALLEALEKAATWFEDYAKEHYAKAKTAPDGREQHSREVKGKTNKDRAAELRAAITLATDPGKVGDQTIADAEPDDRAADELRTGFREEDFA